MKHFAALLTLVFLVTPAQAQGLGGLFGGKKDDSSASQKGAVKGPSMEDALKQGAELITYVGIATELGISALDQIRQAYPPGRFPKIDVLCNRQAEAKKNGKNIDLDSETSKSFSDIGPEIENMEKEYKDYKKDKTANFGKAYGKLGLAALADGIATLRVQDTIKGLQGGLDEIAKNPFKITQAGKLKTQIATLVTIGSMLPVQLKCFQGVRGISKSVAAAEKIKLSADLKPEDLGSVEKLQASSKELID